ncbi:hypothetical protein ACOME3_009128 [Neoechinorhynchus agilis]
MDQHNVSFNDPLFKWEWFCSKIEDGGSNVIDGWKRGFSGRGVSICIIDDGLDHKHDDLSSRYRPDLSFDFNDPDDPLHDPMPSTFDGVNSHGTRCAGLAVAEANNGVCGVGVAYRADIAGHRILDGVITGMTEGKSFDYKNEDTFIKSLSWGPNDDGKSMERPGILASHALATGVRLGRNGRGTIFVWASGNGGYLHDHCGADAYVSNQNVLAIGSVNRDGQLPYFTEYCPSVLAVVPSGGMSCNMTSIENAILGCVTTDVNNKCSMDFIGTSASAPLAAGIIALVIEANPNLTHRDVMHIITRTSQAPRYRADETWKINGAGFLVSDLYGFGVMDAGRMIDEALRWNNTEPRAYCDIGHVEHNKDGLLIPGKTFVSTILFNPDASSEIQVGAIEHTVAY